MNKRGQQYYLCIYTFIISLYIQQRRKQFTSICKWKYETTKRWVWVMKMCVRAREREKATEGRVNSRKNVFHTPLNSFIYIHWLSENWNVLLQLNDWLNTDWWPDNIGIECHTLLAFGSTLIIIKKYVNGWREKNGNTNNNVSCKWVRVYVCAGWRGKIIDYF